MLSALKASRRGTILEVTQRLSKVTKRFATFFPALIRPRLVLRGLLEERRRVMFFFSRSVAVSTWHLTAAGRREADRLREQLDEAPAIRDYLDTDPARATSMATALGPLLVLVPALLPVLGMLGLAMAMPAIASLGDGGGDHSPGWLADVDSYQRS